MRIWNNWEKVAAQRKIAEAERALGPLNFKQMTDLLLDNFFWLTGWDEARDLVRVTQGQ